MRSAKDIRKGVGDCNKAYLEFADAGASANWVFGFTPYLLGVALLGLLLLTFAVLMWASVVALLWSSFTLMVNTLLAILPGPARTGILRDLASIAANLVYVVVNMVVISVVVKLIEWAFSTVGGPLGVKFIAVDILLLAGIFMLVWTKARHSKTECSAWKSLTRAITGRDPVPTRVDKGTQWVSGTTQAAAGRSISGAGRRMLKVATSKPAIAAATVAAGAATGGAAAGATAKTMRAARTAATINDIRQGNPASAGAGVGRSITQVAHQHLAAKVDAAKAIHRHHRDTTGPARATTGHQHLDSAAKLTGSVQRRMDQATVAWTSPLINAERAIKKPITKATTSFKELTTKATAPLKELTNPTPPPAPRRAITPPATRQPAAQTPTRKRAAAEGVKTTKPPATSRPRKTSSGAATPAPVSSAAPRARTARKPLPSPRKVT